MFGLPVCWLQGLAWGRICQTRPAFHPLLVCLHPACFCLAKCGWLWSTGGLSIILVPSCRTNPHATAVGVDNMMILAAALEQQPASHPLPHRVGLALAAVGPSITLAGELTWRGRVDMAGKGNGRCKASLALACKWQAERHSAACAVAPCIPDPPLQPAHSPTASCEVVAFALGGMTSMPALRNFSVCAALAVLLDFLLQVTAFVALLALDTRRLEQGRFDCWPWRRCGAVAGWQVGAAVCTGPRHRCAVLQRAPQAAWCCLHTVRAACPASLWPPSYSAAVLLHLQSARRPAVRQRL